MKSSADIFLLLLCWLNSTCCLKGKKKNGTQTPLLAPAPASKVQAIKVEERSAFKGQMQIKGWTLKKTRCIILLEPSASHIDHAGPLCSDGSCQLRCLLYGCLVAPGAASTKMSVEDLTLDCPSDSEDQGVEKKARDLFMAEEAVGDVVVGGVRGIGIGGEDDVLYLELFLLFDNLKSFQRIYFNNALIDLEVRT